jgi:hypothetical protein
MARKNMKAAREIRLWVITCASGVDTGWEQEVIRSEVTTDAEVV